jgi:hypothetical protein
MKSNAEYLKLLQARGISLQRFGLSDFALRRADAIVAIDLLQATSIAILGGDVFFNKATGIELAYANWHSDQADDESDDRFVIRSCFEAKRYIESFPSTDAEPIFVLEPKL